MIENIIQNCSADYVGTAPCHTIGLVIANIDPVVRLLLQLPEHIASIGILSTRIGTGTVVVAMDEAVKATNTEFKIRTFQRYGRIRWSGHSSDHWFRRCQ